MTSENTKYVNWYFENLKIEISKINIKSSLLCYKTNLENYINKAEIIKQNWNMYIDNYDKWHFIMMKYSGKLTNYIYNSILRKEVANYIKLFLNKKEFINSDLLIVIDILENNKFINDCISIDLIDSIRYDNSHPLKWITEYKDHMLKKYRIQKPIKPVKPYNNIYQNFFTNIKNIHYPLLKQGCDFYVIDIHIPLLKGYSLDFFSPKLKKWLRKYRTITSNGPCNVPCNVSSI
jgi:hypothetical protein